MFPTLNKENFQTTIESSAKLVVVDFWSPTCGPCDLHSEQLAKVQAQMHDSMAVFKVNVDVEGALADQQQILAMPTTQIYKQGKLIRTVLGVQSRADLLEIITPLLQD